MRPRLTTLLIVLWMCLGPGVLHAQLPAAPSNFEVHLQNGADDKGYYVFFWQDNSDSETSFQLEAKAGTGSFADINGASVAKDKEVLDGELNNWPVGTTVEFRMAAVNSSGRSYSNVVSVTMEANTFAPPASVTATAVNDSQITLQWTDAANTDAGVEIEMRRVGVAEFVKLTDWHFYWPTGITITQLNASTGYEFRLRAYHGTSPETRVYSDYSTIATATTASFSGVPAGLTATASDETTLQLSWADSFSSESGYEVQGGVKPASGPTQFEVLGGTNADETTTGPIPDWVPGMTYEFRIRAVSMTNGTPVYSGFSNVASITMPFYKPSSLAVTSTTHSTATLTWQDNSQAESGYDILVRAAGDIQFVYWDSAAGANQTGITITDLPAGLQLEFAVRAYHEYEAGGEPDYTFSDLSNITVATTKDWFFSRLNQGATVGQNFSYTLMATAVSPRLSWSVTGLPPGLTFNSSTGVISGIPLARGAFQCAITATYASGWIAQDTLSFRILAAPAGPAVVVDTPPQRIQLGSQYAVDLQGAYTDSDTESAVKVTTNRGSFNIMLYDSATPQTVANFLGYVNDPDEADNYSNSLIHRAVPGFVIQGGGYKMTAPHELTAIPVKPSPQNEPGLANTRGTIAMAKMPGNPNSATNEFFINLGNNAANLDSQNGGFTVFGRVAGGMSVPDLIAATPRSTITPSLDGQPATFEDFPGTLDNADSGVRIASISQIPALSYAIVGNSNPALLEAQFSGSTLLLTGLASGVSTITYTVTDLDGNTLTRQISVTVETTLAQWLGSWSLSPADQAATADPDHDSLTNLEEFAFMSPSAVESSVQVLPVPVLVDDNGVTRQGIKFRMRKFASELEYVVQSSDSLVADSWQNTWSWKSGIGAPAPSGVNDPLIIQEHADHYEVTILDDADPATADRRFLRVKLILGTLPAAQ